MTPSPMQRIMCAVPGLRWLYHAFQRHRVFGDPDRAPFLTSAPPGHFYSPLPTRHDVDRVLAAPRSRAWVEASGVALRDDAQIELLRAFAAFNDTIPFGPRSAATGCRYWYGNTWFDECDAIVLHCMLRHFTPAKLIEIGSGFSTAVTLDTNDRFLDRTLELMFVEPNPERLQTLLRPEDRTTATIITEPVWAVDRDRLTDLRAGEVLFIDTSHVVKVGSDVHGLLFDVLPRLAPGVIVHLHDIFWPFEYPQDWFEMGRAYNEAYLVQALLMGGDRYEILFFNHYMQETHPELMRTCLPDAMRSRGSSLWLRVNGPQTRPGAPR